jgi:hypothetical protein
MHKHPRTAKIAQTQEQNDDCDETSQQAGKKFGQTAVCGACQ